MKIALITGPTGGIGKATAENLVLDHDLILWCRKPLEQNTLIAQLKNIRPSANIWTCGCDLSDWAQLAIEVQKVKSFTRHIDTLILNAGQFANPCVYIDGLEQNYRAGHLGHMLLALQIRPLLKNAAFPRIVIVSSIAHRFGKAMRPFNGHQHHNALIEYADLKLANRLFALAWSHFHPEIPAVSLHPGVVGSNFGARSGGWLKWLFILINPFILTPQQGANTTIWLSRQQPSWIDSQKGQYFYRKNAVDVNCSKRLLKEAISLWECSISCLSQHLNNP